MFPAHAVGLIQEELTSFFFTVYKWWSERNETRTVIFYNAEKVFVYTNTQLPQSVDNGEYVNLVKFAVCTNESSFKYKVYCFLQNLSPSSRITQLSELSCIALAQSE